MCSGRESRDTLVVRAVPAGQERQRAVKGREYRAGAGESVYEGSPVATYSIVNAWPSDSEDR